MTYNEFSTPVINQDIDEETTDEEDSEKDSEEDLEEDLDKESRQRPTFSLNKQYHRRGSV